MRKANYFGLSPEEHELLEQSKKTLQKRLNWNVPKGRRKARECGVIDIKGGKHFERNEVYLVTQTCRVKSDLSEGLGRAAPVEFTELRAALQWTEQEVAEMQGEARGRELNKYRYLKEFGSEEEGRNVVVAERGIQID